MTYPRCGGYVLLRELEQDALGSLHRAGRVSGEAIGDLVLLRRLPGAASGAAVAALPQRRALAASLSSPFLGELRDAGEVDGTAFLAYDYRSGVTAARLLALADERMAPLSPELAAVVADRAAQALLALWGARGGPALLAPELLWVSTEGEVRLLGIEAAPALRSLAVANPALHPWISPESRRGEAEAGEAEDVWALGALLTALLTGRTPPADAGDETWLAGLTLAEDELPLPEPLAELIGRSLVPRAQRLSRVEAWQKALGRAVEMSGWRATPFQLAVYMHGLCKAEMAREPRDVERERAEALRPAPAAPAPVAAAPSPSPLEPFTAEEPAADAAPTRGGRGGLLAAAAAAAVLLAAGGWWLLAGRGPAPAAPAAQEPVAAAPAATPPAPVASPAPTVALPATEDLERRLAALMAEREKSLSQHYSQEIQQLRSQLDETRREEAAAAPAATAPVASPRQAEPLRPRVAEAAPVPAPAGPDPRAAPAEEHAAPPPTAAAAPAPSAPAGPAAEAEAPLLPAKLLQFEPPAYPVLARRQRVEGTVVLTLRVDAAGRVTEVRFLRRVAQDVGINEAAEAAARKARFTPATREGRAVESWYTLTIPFQL